MFGTTAVLSRRRLVVAGTVVAAIALFSQLNGVLKFQEYCSTGTTSSSGTGTTTSSSHGSSNSGLEKDSSSLTALPTFSAGGATGDLFSGAKIRTFEGTHNIVLVDSPNSPGAVRKRNMNMFPFVNEVKDPGYCNQWAVVTTINEPSESILRFADIPKWCFVIVGDNKTPDNSYEALATKDNVFYLSSFYQKEHLLDNAFVKKMPFNSFARKNIGFLFAIQFGAKVIFDFDDDNLLTTLEDGLTVPPPFLWKEEDENAIVMDGSMFVRFPPVAENTAASTSSNQLAFNPYPHMGPSQPTSWPRGFPIDELQQYFNQAPAKLDVGDIPYASVGVIQSICDGDPDNDAIYRMTQPSSTSFTFERNPQSMSLLIPQNGYSPYNAQATTHLYSSLWGLYLPISVPGRVTDIWRSYITQRIMKDVGLHLVYTPPIVFHDRSSHNYLADFQAESDLYLKTSKLLQFLDDWESSAVTLPARIYSLWISLYEHDYIGLTDVYAIKEWLITLSDIGYKFPTPPQSKSESTSGSSPARVQPSLNGQPYRAKPYYNVNHEGKTYAEMGQHDDEKGWNKWLSTLDIDKRPTQDAVIKLIMMTMDEWPILQSWTMFHGELLGFENLYIIDGSKDPRCISFLRFARDTLGANVLFSTANLNELERLLSQIGNDIGPSSDFILKVDTDEFLQVYNKEEGTLSTSLVHDYLKGFATNSAHALRRTGGNFGNFHVGYSQQSFPSREVCANGTVDASVTAFPLRQVEELIGDKARFKTVYNSNRVFETGINLGGHNQGREKGVQSDVGVFHFHARCFHHEIENTKKAVTSHNYISATDSNEEALTKMIDLLGGSKEDLCNGGEFSSTIASSHKVIFYAKALQCPIQTEEQFWVGLPEVGLHNNEFRDFLQMVEGKYTVFKVH